MTRPARARTSSLGDSTLAVHGGGPGPSPGAPVVPPIVQSSTFYFSGTGGADEELRYSRYGNNPNQVQVGRKVAELEGKPAAAPVASGMAGTAMTLLALTKSGDHVVASRHLYGTTKALLEQELPRRGVRTTFVDPEKGREWRQASLPETRVYFLELPTNPTLRVFDPRPMAELAHARGITMVADTTFASPVNLRAGELGVDVVIHSATKYLGGHSDLVAGVVAGTPELVDEVLHMVKLYGPALDPHAAWLLDRGLRTLDVRVKRHNENAMALARWLEEQPGVERVFYPGLASHPDHALAAELLRGFGGMVSMVLHGGGEAADRFIDGLELALAAPSLGGVETLVSQPRHTSHVGWSPEERAAAGIPDGFVRVSVGLEDPEDLIADFSQALGAARAAVASSAAG